MRDCCLGDFDFLKTVEFETPMTSPCFVLALFLFFVLVLALFFV